METFQDIDEAFSYIEKLTNFEKKPPKEVREYRLSRMTTLLAVFDNPHLKVPAVHIAGTKGKGSTAHLLTSICMEAGLKTGLYTSPHILSYKERFTVNKEEASNALLLEIVNGVFTKLGKTDLPIHSEPTTFEILTLIAFLLFEREKCDCNIIETGIGGRLDATNLINPVCSVITHIELEHTNILGDTLEKIATEKAGIIKLGKPVFTGMQPKEATEVIREKADEQDAALFLFEDYLLTDTKERFGIVYGDSGVEYFTSPEHLPGRVQSENAAVAARSGEYVLEMLLPQSDFDTRLKWIRNGISATRIPCRFERYDTGQSIIVIDGAHTVSSISYVTDTFTELYGHHCPCLFGMVEGKNVKGVCRTIVDSFSTVIITQPGTFKKSDLSEIYDILNHSEGNADITIIPEGEIALNFALNSGSKAICVTGSFYLAGVIARICKQRGYRNV